MHSDQDVALAVQEPHRTAYLQGSPEGGSPRISLQPRPHEAGLIGVLPGIAPSALGDPSMAEVHHTRYPYICGEMANGIATVEMVAAIAAHGMLGFFGAAGLTVEKIEAAVADLEARCGHSLWGSNLIHSPQAPELEEATVDLYLRRRVRRVSASAFLALRPSVVRYAFSGVHTEPTGGIVRRNHVFAKISRPEVARQFLSPPPEAMLQSLVRNGQLTAEEASLARHLPVAEDITVEADSGGHTDNRPLTVLLPAILSLRDELASRFSYRRPIRIGAAGGLGTPAAVAGAFALGASYVLTGSINQCTRESGQGESAKAMLAQAGIADVMMAPAGDMFEMGVKVQVLKRGTLFGVRAAKLYELYRLHDSLDRIPAEAVSSLERDIFRQDLAGIWQQTREYFLQRKPAEVERAEREPRHRMALVFRWYLGQSSRWPTQNHAERRVDYQIWCGPAMGAFNEWVAGSFLENPAQRTVGQIALNLMFGAASITRAQQLRACGVAVPAPLFHYRPRPLAADEPGFELASIPAHAH